MTRQGINIFVGARHKQEEVTGMAERKVMQENGDGSRQVVIYGDTGRSQREAERSYDAGCHRCHQPIGTAPFYLVEGRRIHAACTREL